MVGAITDIIQGIALILLAMTLIQHQRNHG
jgi:hypothetical protein